MLPPVCPLLKALCAAHPCGSHQGISGPKANVPICLRLGLGSPPSGWSDAQGLWPTRHPGPALQPPGTHVVCEVHQHVLRHVVAVQQSKHDPLQVLLVDEAVLIKICKEEMGVGVGGLEKSQSPRLRVPSASGKMSRAQLPQTGLEPGTRGTWAGPQGEA